MLQSLRNRRNRKGFTLAELLIVVAIIAVLVAIAVPLFVGALDQAEQRVFESNQRSLKSFAVTEILLNQKAYNAGTADENGHTSWYAVGTVGDNGDIQLLDITGITSEPKDAAIDYDAWKTQGKTGNFYVKITQSDVDSNASYKKS